ncbi:MAG TPA: hypothetical protein VNS58_13335 [Puia sp.]|nr:hypothetical protein [Puia sp.]
MKKLKAIIYNCRRATELIGKKQLTALTLRERLELGIHLIGCSFCRLFQRQSILINRWVRGLLHATPPAGTKLDDYFKEELQKRIDEKMRGEK